MGLFSRKKKEEQELNFPQLDEKLPTYTSETKKLISTANELDFPPLPRRDFDVPIRKPLSYYSPQESLPKKEPLPKIPLTPKYPPIREEIYTQEEKPLFVEIEKYKDAITLINTIKEQIANAENILLNIEEINHSEIKEIASWRSTINKLKTNLLTIEKKIS